jgi:predicted metal-dependent TIM-barrel fold hydrolase
MNPPTIDTFTVNQAAMALGVSPKRVRQLIEEGKLKAHSLNPVKLKQGQVLILREQRSRSKRVQNSDLGKATANSAVLEEIKNLIERSFIANQRALESAEASAKRNEENLIAQINDLKEQLAAETNRKKRWRLKSRA